MTTTEIPLTSIDPDGREVVWGYLKAMQCCNCGTLTPVAEMWRDPRTDELECLECDGVNSVAFRRRQARADEGRRAMGLPPVPIHPRPAVGR